MTRAAVAAALLVGACTSTVVTLLGPRRPSKPDGCAIDLFPNSSPPYPHTPIAKVRVECDPMRWQGCVDILRAEGCRAGADAVVRFKETTGEVSMFVDATFVVKTPETPTAPAAVDPNACQPICSPGFACQAGQCVPQCNPACEAGEICNRKRMCEPAPARPPAPAAVQPNPEGDVPQVVPQQ